MICSHSPRRFAHQAGAGLISMMIGVMISLITVAALLVLYKTMINVSANTTRAIVRDGAVSAALISAQSDLQAAGFGVPVAAALDTKFAIPAARHGREVVWRFKRALADADFYCGGLLIVDGAGVAPAAKGLYRLQDKLCADASSIHWSMDERVLLAGAAAFFVPKTRNAQAYGGAPGVASTVAEAGAVSLAGGAAGYVFEWTAGVAGATPCLPYRQSDAACTSPPRVSLVRADGAGPALFTVYLPNLANPAPAPGGAGG